VRLGLAQRHAVIMSDLSARRSVAPGRVSPLRDADPRFRHHHHIAFRATSLRALLAFTALITTVRTIDMPNKPARQTDRSTSEPIALFTSSNT